MYAVRSITLLKPMPKLTAMSQACSYEKNTLCDVWLSRQELREVKYHHQRNIMMILV